MQAAPERSYRYRSSCQIIYGHYTEFMELQGRKQAITAERRWAPSTFWIATAGGLNDFFLERECPTRSELATGAAGAGSRLRLHEGDA
jgi:hypothetical protein